MYIKVIKSYREVVAVCDSELLGKKFEQENKELNVKESFYKGQLYNKEQAIKVLQDMKKEDATFNIIGNKSVQTALEAGIISENQIGEIAGIKFALVLL